MLKLLNLLCLCFIYCKSLNLAKFYRRLQLLLGTFIPVPTQTQRISSMCFKAQKNKALQDCKETGGRAKPLWCWRSSLKSTPGFLGPYLTFQVLLVAEDHVEPGCMTLAQCPMSPGHRTRSCQPPVTAHTREQTAIPGDPFCTVMLKRKPGDDKMRFNSIAKKKIFLKKTLFPYTFKFILRNLDIGPLLPKHETVDAKLQRHLCKFTLHKIF